MAFFLTIVALMLFSMVWLSGGRPKNRPGATRKGQKRRVTRKGVIK